MEHLPRCNSDGRKQGKTVPIEINKKTRIVKGRLVN